MGTPVDELKALGWTSRQILDAARREIDTEVTEHDPLALQKAVQRVYERARAGLPTYAQLESRVAELEAQNKRLFAVLDMAKDTLVGYGIRSEAVQQTIAAIMTQCRGPAMTAELLRDAADCLDAEVQQLNAMAREIDHRTLELAHEYVTPGHAQPAPGGNPDDGSSPSRSTEQREALGRAAYEAEQREMEQRLGPCGSEPWEEKYPETKEHYCIIADAVIRAYEAQRQPPAYDREALALLAARTRWPGWVKDAGGQNLESWLAVVDAVLAAAWPEMIVEYQWMLRESHRAGDDLKEMTESYMQELERANEAERVNGTLVEEIQRVEERATDIRTRLMDACVFGEEQAERARKAEEERGRYERTLKELWDHSEFNRGLFRWVADTLGIEREEAQS